MHAILPSLFSINEAGEAQPLPPLNHLSLSARMVNDVWRHDVISLSFLLPFLANKRVCRPYAQHLSWRTARAQRPCVCCRAFSDIQRTLLTAYVLCLLPVLWVGGGDRDRRHAHMPCAHTVHVIFSLWWAGVGVVGEHCFSSFLCLSFLPPSPCLACLGKT